MKAQVQASLACVQFMQSIGKDAQDRAVMMNFEYQARNSTTGLTESKVMSVPALTLVPIPYISVSEPSSPSLTLLQLAVGTQAHVLHS